MGRHGLIRMFELDWADRERWLNEKVNPENYETHLPRSEVSKTLWGAWKEHCVECAVPECYGGCPLYQKRADGECQRLVYGMYPNDLLVGRYGFGADMRFRRWGKMELNLYDPSVTLPPMPYFIERSYERLSHTSKVRLSKLLGKLKLVNTEPLDEFVLECFSPGTEEFSLILDYFLSPDRKSRQTVFRHNFIIQPGHNYFTLPVSTFYQHDFKGYLYLVPDESAAEPRIIFTWLDFVRYRRKGKLVIGEEPASKVKCVAWDLDNTLWEGIVSEREDIELRQDSVALVHALDQRGILQTVVSKNDQEVAWGQIEKLGLTDYFLYPAINWGQKSENIKAVSRNLNLSLNSFAVIDDSPFERAEIAAALPQVRIYSDDEINGMLGKEEFDVPVTEATRNRRQSYQLEMQRNQIQASYSGSYEDFLRSCGMTVYLFVPVSESQVHRCWELIQRSNQLNLSGNRYTREELDSILADDNRLCVGISCKDRFGDYGIVGFVSLLLDRDIVKLHDFVISCRVAQKRVEHSFFRWLYKCMSADGYRRLQTVFHRSLRNKPLWDVLMSLEFNEITKESDAYTLESHLQVPAELAEVNQVEANSMGFSGRGC